jgi:hypothetical protein
MPPWGNEDLADQKENWAARHLVLRNSYGRHQAEQAAVVSMSPAAQRSKPWNPQSSHP